MAISPPATNSRFRGTEELGRIKLNLSDLVNLYEYISQHYSTPTILLAGGYSAGKVMDLKDVKKKLMKNLTLQIKNQQIDLDLHLSPEKYEIEFAPTSQSRQAKDEIRSQLSRYPKGIFPFYKIPWLSASVLLSISDLYFIYVFQKLPQVLQSVVVFNCVGTFVFYVMTFVGYQSMAKKTFARVIRGTRSQKSLLPEHNSKEIFWGGIIAIFSFFAGKYL